MNHCRTILILAASLLFVRGARPVLCETPNSPPAPDFRQLLLKLATADADPCNAPGAEKEDTRNTEYYLLQQAENEITRELNAAETRSSSPVQRATAALKKLERLSGEINAAWPEDHRFHFEVLDLPPMVVVKVSIRTHLSYTAFGIPAGNSKEPSQQWQEIGSEGASIGHEILPTSLDLYLLQRSPSGKARFLASFGYVGCAGNTFGVQYDVREWDPKNSNYLEQVIKQDGAFNIDADPNGTGPTAKDPFAPVGVLSTTGSQITLPYCWGSPLDTWDNLSLCAVDTYDLSGDVVRFLGRRYNRPDLVPVAKVLEYAKKNDYPELRAYCASDVVARKVMREGEYGFDVQLETVRLSAGRERVRAAYSGDPGFVVEKHGDRWLVVSFSSR